MATMHNVFDPALAKSAPDPMTLELIDLVETRASVYVLSADMGGYVAALRDRHPDRFLEFGIAESNVISVAAGMAASGLLPYVIAMAPFGIIKTAEQVRTDVAATHLPVRIMANLSGLAMGYFGASHQAIEDIAIARSIVGLTLVAPSDANSTRALMRATVDMPGPVYYRLSTLPDHEIYPQVPAIEPGRLALVRPGRDATIIATGVGTSAALAAAELLVDEGIDVEVLDALYLKPFDEQGVIAAMRRTGRILTVEEHLAVGGLGAVAAEIIGKAGLPGKLGSRALPEEDMAVAFPAELVAHYGITGASVAQDVRELLR